MKGYKQAQGNILVVVFIILIVITGIVVVWNFAYPMIKQKGGEADTSLFSVSMNIKEVSLSKTGASKVIVQRSSGEGEISSLKFIFYDEDGQSYSASQDSDIPKELETKTYFFSPFSNLKNLKSVSVVPVVNNKLGLEFKFNYVPISNFPPGLVSWWRFNDNRDSVGNNHGLNLVNINNGNLILDGNSYMDVGNDISLSMNKQFAVSAWIKANSYGGNIISKSTNYEVSINPDDLNSDLGKIRFTYGSDDYYIESFNSINLNNPVHIVVSIDWGGVWKMYINGNQEFIGSKSIVPTLNSDNVLIGRGFNGEIGDIMLFNRSLSVENIEFLYHNPQD
ncbi:MAG: LamG domain-containing protein [Candidatus Nanoarchaeia archaeon]|nr:LamG domain-containing protein [Candidatus Nanoarchaeia archaeon]